MVVDPTATPVTSPLPLTVATPVSPSSGVTVGAPDGPAALAAASSVTVPGFVATAVTVIAAVPLCPSLVAVIVAEPAATPVTSPLPLTVATPVLLLAHVTTRPVSAAPLASFGVAESCTVCPTCTLGVAGLTVTDATGTLVTVSAEVPFTPSLVAVIVAEPAATPLTTPLPLTVATAELLLAHVTTRPVNTAPPASFGVAESRTVCPTCTLGAAGLTVTDATGAFTVVIAVVPLMPSMVAVIVVGPAAMPLTSPLPSTVATPALLLTHVTARPVKGAPVESCGVAANCTACATITVAAVGVIATVFTGTGVTVTAPESVPPPLVAVTLYFPN